MKATVPKVREMRNCDQPYNEALNVARIGLVKWCDELTYRLTDISVMLETRGRFTDAARMRSLAHEQQEARVQLLRNMITDEVFERAKQ